jgi:hypothetical protein
MEKLMKAIEIYGGYYILSDPTPILYPLETLLDSYTQNNKNDEFMMDILLL